MCQWNCFDISNSCMSKAFLCSNAYLGTRVIFLGGGGGGGTIEQTNESGILLSVGAEMEAIVIKQQLQVAVLLQV